MWLRLTGRGGRSAGAGTSGDQAPGIGETYDARGNPYGAGVVRNEPPGIVHSTPPLDVVSPAGGWDGLADGNGPPHAFAKGSEGLRVEEQTGEHTRRLTLIGQLDLDTAPLLQAEISRCHASGFKAIVLDLSRLDFIDSTGLWVITTARRWCDTHGCGFTIVPGPQPVQSVFELTGLSDVLPFVAQ